MRAGMAAVLFMIIENRATRTCTRGVQSVGTLRRTLYGAGSPSNGKVSMAVLRIVHNISFWQDCFVSLKVVRNERGTADSRG